jgi:hypothetical protein
MRLVLLLAAACCGGCLGSPAAGDASANVDMPGPADLTFVDYAGDYDCVQLNQCLQPCKNQLCINACIAMSTPSAVATQMAVQQCFAQYCPTTAGGTCADPTATLCLVCLQNAQAAMSMACQPTDAPECHQCLTQVTACRNDRA